MDMIENVARAICRADPEVRMGDADGVVEQRVNIEWVHYVGAAKAAIAAMQQAQEPVAWMDAKAISADALLAACEGDPADPDHPNTVSITTDDFEAVVRCAVENWLETHPPVQWQGIEGADARCPACAMTFRKIHDVDERLRQLSTPPAAGGSDAE